MKCRERKGWRGGEKGRVGEERRGGREKGREVEREKKREGRGEKGRE